MREKLISYLVPALFAFIFAYLLWEIQRERVDFTYEVTESVPFPREQGLGQYFIIRLRNSGSKEVKDISFAITFRSGAIESTQTSSADLVTGVRQSPSEWSGTVPLLNPSETLSLTVTAKGNPGIEPPQVVARAPGITAGPPTSGLPSWLGTVALVTVAAVLASTAAVLRRSQTLSSSIAAIGEASHDLKKHEESLADRIKRTTTEGQERHNTWLKEMEERRREQEERMAQMEQELQRQEQEQQRQEQLVRDGTPDKPQIVFSVLSRNGLVHRFFEIVQRSDNMSYWRTAALLFVWFLLDEEPRKCVRALEELVLREEMAPSSRGFGYYLLSKMEHHQGDSERAIAHLQRCRELTPLMYEYLSAQEPGFDLVRIRRHLELALSDEGNPSS